MIVLDKIKVILVDDHQIVRDGIKALIAGEREVEIIGEASGGGELLELLKTKEPHVLLMDINMPDISGIELAKIIYSDYPGVRVLMLSMHISEEFIFNAIEAGVKGYLPKTTTRQELVDAIKSIANGGEFFNNTVSEILLKSYIRKTQSGARDKDEQHVQLTKRELEIIKLYAEGMSNQEIADKLFISIRTVESHKNNIMNKLELKSTVDLVKYAIRNNIISV